MLDGDIEKCHGRIPQQAIHDAIMLNDDSRSGLEKLLRDRSEFFDPQLVRQAGVFAAIGE
jgi:hypothetical protein